jgi:adenine-specific DNA-methyltransferase
MMTFEEKLTELKKLTDQFAFNLKQYKSADYDEANTRVDFIDKFFSLLDWDVSNSQGYSEAYRDVIREDKVKIEGKQKAPDYSFRIGGIRKFFVEAKKPSVNIKDDLEPAFQVRRYGYTAKLPLSILTDFEEFAIYDTRIKPDKSDKSSVARVFYCSFDKYQENFEFIFSTFSKNAILKGSFDKYVVDHKNKQGTSTVDKELLKLVEGWRTDLAKNIALRNAQVDIYNINNAVQKVIDRIIFLRIAEDKEIEPYGQLLSTTTQSGVYGALNTIFTRANEKYNSGLFKQDDWLTNLAIDDKVFIATLKGLYYPECPYEFSILPIEILGNIYEQFLGKTIKFKNVKDGHTVVVEEKPEVRKAGGVYYTPKYIVDYIVRNTIEPNVMGKHPDEIAKMSLCDPACGSGSFLVGAYQFLLNFHLSFYSEPANVKAALKLGKLFPTGENIYRLTIEEKQRILVNNIFGVDIDP